MTEEYYEEEDYTAQNNSGTIRRILSLVKPYRLWVVGFLSAVMVVSVLDSYFTYLSKQIIDLGIVPGDAEALTAIVTEYMSLIVVQAGAVFLFIYLAGVLGERVMYDLRKKLFNNLQDLSLSYYSRTPVGWIMSRVTSDTEKVSDLVTWGMLDVTWAILNIVTAAYFMMHHQLAAGADRHQHHPDPGVYRRAVPQENPVRVPQRAQVQLQDHRLVQ